MVKLSPFAARALGCRGARSQQNFIDMEKLLELLDQNVDIRDAPDAADLVVSKGELEFGTSAARRGAAGRGAAGHGAAGRGRGTST